MTADGHLREALSALLDGELTAQEEAAANVHLQTCDACRIELGRVEEARRLVRGLPPVDPPFGMYERALLRRRRWRAVAGWAASAAAAIAVISMATSRPDPVTPQIPEMVGVHAATASVAGEPVSQLAPAAVPVTFQEP